MAEQIERLLWIYGCFHAYPRRWYENPTPALWWRPCQLTIPWLYSTRTIRHALLTATTTARLQLYLSPLEAVTVTLERGAYMFVV